MEYQNIKLIEAKRKKVLMLSTIISVIFHMLLFFSFKIGFAPYRQAKLIKIMRIRRVRIPPGNRPGPPSASSAKKRAKPKPIRNKNITKKKPSKKRKVKSKLKVASKKEEKENAPEEQEMALDQKESEYDVMSMIEGSGVIPGGGNQGDGILEGLTYDENTVYEYGYDEEEPEEVASVVPEKFLGTMATPIVTSQPYTSIMTTFTDIPYPAEVKIKKEKLKAGICRVYIRLDINSDGELINAHVRAPKTKADRAKYAIFLETVMETVNSWKFDDQLATVFVDVRFTID
ncbi:hypothetical protein ACFL2A_07395 [Thermodesulfobacteriota bacterium]